MPQDSFEKGGAAPWLTPGVTLEPALTRGRGLAIGGRLPDLL